MKVITVSQFTIRGKMLLKLGKTRLLIISLVLLLGIGTTSTIAYQKHQKWLNLDRVRDKVQVELGTDTLDVSAFLLDPTETGTFYGDLSHVKLTQVGEYPLKILAGPKVYSSKLIVSDTTAPILKLHEIKTGIDAKLDVYSFVKTLDDLSNTTVFFQDEPDFTLQGEQSITIICRDEFGNEAKASTKLTIIGLRTDHIFELGKIDHIDESLFLTAPSDQIQIQTDLSAIDLSEIGVHKIEILYFGETIIGTIEIRDTIKPIVQAVEVEAFIGQHLSAEQFIKEIYDLSESTVFFKTIPNIRVEGRHQIILSISDIAGNTSDVTTYLTLKKDPNGPAIYNASDIFVRNSDQINYLSGITAFDAADGNVLVTVDASKVNLNQEGTYPLIYMASDNDGNTTRKEVIVTVDFIKPYMPGGSTGSADVDTLADGILSRLINGEMSNSQITSTIYDWVRRSISYSSPASSNFYSGAIEGLRYRRGNCYTHAFTTAAMLQRAGINAGYNVEYEGRHAWALLGGYIVDPTMGRYMVLESSMRDYVWEGFYLYRNDKSDPPETKVEHRTEFINKEKIPFNTFFQLNPDPNSVYPNQVISVKGIDGEKGDLWDRHFVDGKAVPDKDLLIEEGRVITEAVDQIILIGQKDIVRQVIPAPAGTKVVVTNDKSLDGTRVPMTGKDGEKISIQTATSIDSKTGNATFGTPLSTTVEPVSYDIYRYEPLVSWEKQNNEIRVISSTHDQLKDMVTNNSSQIGQRIPGWQDGHESRTVEQKFVDGQATEEYRFGAWIIENEPISYGIYVLAEPTITWIKENDLITPILAVHDIEKNMPTENEDDQGKRIPGWQDGEQSQTVERKYLDGQPTDEFRYGTPVIIKEAISYGIYIYTAPETTEPTDEP